MLDFVRGSPLVTEPDIIYFTSSFVIAHLNFGAGSFCEKINLELIALTIGRLDF